MKIFPSPEYPGLHEQLNDPLVVLLHTALALQFCFPATHLSIFEKNQNLFIVTLHGQTNLKPHWQAKLRMTVIHQHHQLIAEILRKLWLV